MKVEVIKKGFLKRYLSNPYFKKYAKTKKPLKVIKPNKVKYDKFVKILISFLEDGLFEIRLINENGINKSLRLFSKISGYRTA